MFKDHRSVVIDIIYCIWRKMLTRYNFYELGIYYENALFPVWVGNETTNRHELIHCPQNAQNAQNELRAVLKNRCFRCFLSAWKANGLSGRQKMPKTDAASASPRNSFVSLTFWSFRVCSKVFFRAFCAFCGQKGNFALRPGNGFWFVFIGVHQWFKNYHLGEQSVL